MPQKTTAKSRNTKKRAKTGSKKKLTLREAIASDYYDFGLVAGIILINCFGLIMLYSVSSYLARRNFGSDMYFFRRQMIISSVCLAGAVLLSFMDYRKLKKLAIPIYLLSMILMALVKSPLGITRNGARRWIAIGPIEFQPAEVAKIALIILIAALAVDKKALNINGKSINHCILSFVFGGIAAAGAYKLTENLSTAIIIFGIMLGMVFLIAKDLKWFYIFVAALVVFAVAYIYHTYSSTLYITTDEELSALPFRTQRIVAWLRREEFSDGAGYQTTQGLYALASGGFFGRGFGNSIQKLGHIPEVYNDFIFTVICEELGIFGVMIVMILFGYLLYRLFFIAQNAPDYFGSLLVSGIFIHLAIQVIFNICVVLNIMPNTGVTLPFISYGGTSVMFIMAEMGIALSVARRIRFRG